MKNIKDLYGMMENYKTAFVVFFIISLCIFIFQNNQFGFDKGHHGFLSSHGASIAKNLSAKDRFLMFERVNIDKDGNVSYNIYSRFPIISFLILKNFMSIFSPNLSMEIAVARQVMNLFFIGSLLLIFLCIYELSRSYPAAISITLFSFSSFYLNYYNDMIFNDTPALFGYVLAFHGLMVYTLYGRRIQMYIKAIVGISLGWQTFSMLLAYILCCFFFEYVKNRSVVRFIKSEPFRLGAVSLCFGVLLLGFSFYNEMIATGKPITEIGSFQSAKSRIGQDHSFQQQYEAYLSWGAFSKDQLHRIGAMSLPYLFKKSGNFKIVGGVILFLSFVGCCLQKNRILLLTLLFSGFLWAYPVREYAFSHDYQSIYYIGIPVVFFYLIINVLKQKTAFLLPVIVILSVITFVRTNIVFNQSKALASQKVNIITHDFQHIIDYTKMGNVFYIDGNIHEIALGYHAAEYYLSGNFFTGEMIEAEYIISRNRNFNSSPLTPGNSEIFLFRGTPRFAQAFNKRGIDYFRMKDYNKAVQDFTRAIGEDPDFVEAYVNRGIVHNRRGEYEKAVADYELALSKQSDLVLAINSLAWLLSTCTEEKFRDGARAVALAEKGVDLNPGAYHLDTLAAAYAENGDFKKAVKTQKEVMRLIEDKADTLQIMEFKRHLESYQNKRPWREE